MPLTDDGEWSEPLPLAQSKRKGRLSRLQRLGRAAITILIVAIPTVFLSLGLVFVLVQVTGIAATTPTATAVPVSLLRAATPTWTPTVRATLIPTLMPSAGPSRTPSVVADMTPSPMPSYKCVQTLKPPLVAAMTRPTRPDDPDWNATFLYLTDIQSGNYCLLQRFRQLQGIIWAPDNRSLLIRGERNSRDPDTVFLYQIGVSYLRPLAHFSSPDQIVRWAPDDQSVLLLNAVPSDSAPNLRIFDISGGAHTQIIHYGHDGNWSPDGQQVAYIDKGQAYISDFSGTSAYPITPATIYSSKLLWSPDSHHLLDQVGDGAGLVTLPPVANSQTSTSAFDYEQLSTSLQPITWLNHGSVMIIGKQTENILSHPALYTFNPLNNKAPIQIVLPVNTGASYHFLDGPDMAHIFVYMNSTSSTATGLYLLDLLGRPIRFYPIQAQTLTWVPGLLLLSRLWYDSDHVWHIYLTNPDGSLAAVLPNPTHQTIVDFQWQH